MVHALCYRARTLKEASTSTARRMWQSHGTFVLLLQNYCDAFLVLLFVSELSPFENQLLFIRPHNKISMKNK